MALRYTNAVVRKVVEDQTNNEYSLIHIETKGKLNPKTGKRDKRKMTIKHNVCSHQYTLEIYEFLEGKRRCGKCKGKKLNDHFSQSIQSVRKETEEMTNGEYSFVDVHFINAKTKHLFRHNTCGTEFPKQWEKFQAGQRCTTCYQKGKESTASRYVRDILDHLGIEYETEKRFELCINPKTGKTLPFDYYLPDINTLIEIDGEHHERNSYSIYDWESTRKRDKIKNHYAEEKGFKLVRIPAKKWSQLPEILFDIISRDLIPTLTLSEVKAIQQSTHPERINKDLSKIHDGEYRLYDPYYFGVDYEHMFEHTSCGTKFVSTLFKIKDAKTPCSKCRKHVLEKQKHDISNEKLKNKSNNRYSLDSSSIGVDEKGRRLVYCHRCKVSWKVTVGNLMKDAANCPTCFKMEKDMHWRSRLKEIEGFIRTGEKLTKSQKHWIWHNKKRMEEGRLDKDHISKLLSADVIRH